MSSRINSLKEEVGDLVAQGNLLYYAMADNLNKLPSKIKTQLKKSKVKLPSFDSEYETWYSEALVVIQQMIPDRVDDFVKQYKNEKRKEIDFVTEPPRVYRRLHFLRGWSYEQSKQIFPGSEGTGGAHGFRA